MSFVPLLFLLPLFLAFEERRAVNNTSSTAGENKLGQGGGRVETWRGRGLSRHSCREQAQHCMAIGSGLADGIGCGIGRCDAGRGGRGRATQGWDGLRRDVA